MFVMFYSFVVCLWCGGGGGAGRRRAEPLRNQVSESCYRGRDKMQTDDMRRHCECMVLGFYVHERLPNETTWPSADWIKAYYETAAR